MAQEKSALPEGKTLDAAEWVKAQLRIAPRPTAEKLERVHGIIQSS